MPCLKTFITEREGEILSLVEEKIQIEKLNSVWNQERLYVTTEGGERGNREPDGYIICHTFCVGHICH